MAWPTTNDPRVVFVTVRLTASEALDLDVYRNSRGLNRSTAVRECVAEVVTGGLGSGVEDTGVFDDFEL